ncbi:2 TM domain-containing transmembrane protein [Acrasis kona]|uniref:2 TM domain-containing transmembrane protein n=1 Tax=Acrasis kona TaxID=1008807 RepID=A0AAW2ZN10_9EUKA
MSFRSNRDSILFMPLVIMSPVIFFEIISRVVDFYQENFTKYEKLPLFNTTNRLFGLRIIYAFTFLTISLALLFFTFETFESSYVNSRSVFDLRKSAVIELRKNILTRFCCPGRSIKEADITAYLTTQLECSFNHHHAREQFDERNVERSSFVESSLPEIMDVIEHNTGFKYSNATKSWTWQHDFKPLNVIQYHDKRETFKMHDRVQTFFRMLTKGFGLTH